jgi:hypothetical protein
MWHLLQHSLANQVWISLLDYGYGGIVKVRSISHSGRSWVVDLDHYGGHNRRIRVGKAKVLEVL